MLAYEEDRRDKATRDRREKEVREARIVAGLPPTDSPTITSTSSGGRTRRKRMIMPGSGMTLDGRTAAGDHDAALLDSFTSIDSEEVVKALDEAWKIAKVDTVNYWHGTVEYGYDVREALFGKNAK